MSWPVVGIISYETMMLVAIVATFVALVIQISRARPSPVAHDPRIDDGWVGIAIGLDSHDPRSPSISAMLEKAGATEVQT